jgi:hypothetical protein
LDERVTRFNYVFGGAHVSGSGDLSIASFGNEAD